MSDDRAHVLTEAAGAEQYRAATAGAEADRAEDAQAWTSSIEAAVHEVARARDAETALAAAARLRRYVDHLTADLVAEARDRKPPLSWARIGAALGISRQAANERYSEAGQDGAAARRYRRRRRLEALRASAPPG